MAEGAKNTDGQKSFWFDGFFEPSFTMIPDIFFDTIAPNLSESELRAALYIMRRTFGFKKQSDAISISQLIGGITTRDGRTLDSGTGMSRQGVMRGVKGLETKGVITVRKGMSDDGVNQINLYSLRFRPGGVVYEIDYGSLPSRLGVVNDVDSQETVKQETVKQFEFSKDANEKLLDRGDRILISRYLEDLARELSDQASLTSSTTRANNLYLAAGRSIDDYLDLMMEARRRTQGSSASIKTKAIGDGWGRKPKMAYFFGVLEDLLGGSSRAHLG